MDETMMATAALPAPPGEPPGAGPAAGEPPAPRVDLDLRSVSMAKRLDAILSAWRTLPVGGTLCLVNDREPKPLQVMFRVTEPGRHTWSCEKTGPDEWVAFIMKISAKS